MTFVWQSLHSKRVAEPMQRSGGADVPRCHRHSGLPPRLADCFPELRTDYSRIAHFAILLVTGHEASACQNRSSLCPQLKRTRLRGRAFPSLEVSASSKVFTRLFCTPTCRSYLQGSSCGHPTSTCPASAEFVKSYKVDGNKLLTWLHDRTFQTGKPATKILPKDLVKATEAVVADTMINISLPILWTAERAVLYRALRSDGFARLHFQAESPSDQKRAWHDFFLEQIQAMNTILVKAYNDHRAHTAYGQEDFEAFQFDHPFAKKAVNNLRQRVRLGNYSKSRAITLSMLVIGCKPANCPMLKTFKSCSRS